MHKTYRGGGKDVLVITQVIVKTTSISKTQNVFFKKKKYFYKIEAKANSEELESCTPGMSAEREESLETI